MKTLSPADRRAATLQSMLAIDSGLRLVTQGHDGIDVDNVILTVAVRDKGSLEVKIPKSRYDAFAVLDLVELHSTKGAVQ